ncbi:MAG: NAD(P)/FAD-dependent oxidoreductase [Gammaproteobacteria bacterium]|nr:NAD(P)/FAD-dependent oxidoreductase [Gammaproteobacteria bacterium]
MTDVQPANKRRDDKVVIIGAGHNGLVCAAYLARAGREVVVLEAAAQPGGAAVTREFAPGFRVSACAHLLYLLDAQVSRDLALESHGLKMARSNLRTVALAADGGHIVHAGGKVESGPVSPADRAALADYHARLQRFARVMGKQHNRRPPRIGGGDRSDLLGAALLGLDIRLLGRDDMREFLRIAGINVYDVLEETFESPLLKGTLALDAVLGTNLGPRSNNSVLTLLHRMSGTAGGDYGAVALPAGGMGTVTAALAAAAQKSGATLRCSSPVARITLEGDRVSGVQLESGETIAAGTVVSNADPARTLLQLLGARHLETGFAERVRHIRSRGTAAKLHLALDGLPEFTGLDGALLGERLVIAPDPVYVEHAFDHSKYGTASPEPVLEIVMPSVHDRSFSPQGKHVLSAIVQYAPHDAGAGADARRGEFLERILGVLGKYSPGLRRQIVATELLLPADIEREFRITGGHWHHGELALDRFLMLRPVPGAAQYAMPLDGLYLCGAGCHPGGGVMGSAGGNAARAVLAAGSTA